MHTKAWLVETFIKTIKKILFKMYL